MCMLGSFITKTPKLDQGKQLQVSESFSQHLYYAQAAWSESCSVPE